MPEILPTVLIVAMLIAAGLTLIPLVRDRPVGMPLIGGLVLIELGLLALTVLALINLSDTDRDVAGVTFVAYLVGSLLVLPIAGAWARAERSRWGSGVLLIACLVLPVLIVRMNQIWDGHGAN
ncbi:MAG: hypothetical protein GEU86_13230 [Actinophytocola sp.]|nr:hypothetical protein [Actinophytocola sp.]